MITGHIRVNHFSRDVHKFVSFLYGLDRTKSSRFKSFKHPTAMPSTEENILQEFDVGTLGWYTVIIAICEALYELFGTRQKIAKLSSLGIT
jgi:hypothetical protein